MQPRNPAVREGLIFGAGLAVLLVINAVLNMYADIGWGQIITLLAGIGAMLFAGVRAGQATGRANAGMIAGLVTGLFSSAVNLVVVTAIMRSEEHTSELQSHSDLVCRLLLEKKNDYVSLVTVASQ